MTGMVEAAFARIGDSLDELEAGIDDLRSDLQKEQHRSKRLLGDTFNRKKEINILKEGTRNFETLQEENDRLKTAQAELELRLQRVLGYTKGLVEEFRQ